MITAAEASKISDSNMKDEHDSFLFKNAIDKIEKLIRAVASCGDRSILYNVDELVPGFASADRQLRKAVAKELRKNGFSYSEIRRSIDCIWFEVSW